MADVSTQAAARHPPGPVRAYAAELRGLVGLLDPDEGGWYGLFAANDPDGLRDCLAGQEIPPWDVVASLLQDVTRRHGPGAARQEDKRLRALHGAAVAAYDTHVGGGQVLRDRLAATSRDRDEAAARVRTLGAASATGPDPDGSLAADLAWAGDHLGRLDARCAELRTRVTALDESTAPAAAVPRKKRGRSGGSRFAGGADDAGNASGEPSHIVPPGASSADPAPAPRGARFAG
ncbi:MAG: hypothetical protein ACRDOV_12645, partial [Streptomyces sp.]